VSEYFTIAVDAPLAKPLTYKSPDSISAKPGCSVVVPLGNRKAKGIILSSTEKPETKYKIKPINEINAELPLLSKEYLDWLNWMSEYYLYPVGQIAQMFFPPLKKGGKSRKTPVVPDMEQIPPPQLTQDQQNISDDINSKNGFHTHLLWGVTGSGKTEVYLELLNNLKDGEQGLVLVPEISLTPQLIRRFSQRYGDQIAVIHSHLTDRERTNQWWTIVEGKKKILIGARSALFCPFDNLKLIILDEEHESSFKQDEKLKYHARDAAIVLGKNLDIPVVMGSATPSLESWKNASDKKYHLHKLSDRFQKTQLPNVSVVDLRDEDEKQKDLELPSWLSSQLYEKMKVCLGNNEQAALFLNRRGMANVVQCHECGHMKMCPNCDISLTLHSKHHMVCHYCDYHENFSEICVHCKQGEMIPLGVGTEKIEKDLGELFPNKCVVRIDRDEIQTRYDLEEAIHSIETGKAHIIIGTQMIAKGLDFPDLTLLGIVLADIGFALPDFRSVERNFQLLTQVSGRPGRRKKQGQVVVQTYNPDHPSLVHAKNHDYFNFANSELVHRKELNYPPYGRLGSLRIQGLKQENVMRASEIIRKKMDILINKFPSHYKEIIALGPAPSGLFKLHNKYRYHALIKCPHHSILRSFCHALLDTKEIPSTVKLSADIDPLFTL